MDDDALVDRLAHDDAFTGFAPGDEKGCSEDSEAGHNDRIGVAHARALAKAMPHKGPCLRSPPERPRLELERPRTTLMPHSAVRERQDSRRRRATRALGGATRRGATTGHIATVGPSRPRTNRRS